MELLTENILKIDDEILTKHKILELIPIIKKDVPFKYNRSVIHNLVDINNTIHERICKLFEDIEDKVNTNIFRIEDSILSFDELYNECKYNNFNVRNLSLDFILSIYYHMYSVKYYLNLKEEDFPLKNINGDIYEFYSEGTTYNIINITFQYNTVKFIGLDLETKKERILDNNVCQLFYLEKFLDVKSIDKNC